jgi:cell wall-associated NlpC family hydrolase
MLSFGMILGGCAPKRVTTSGVVVAPADPEPRTVLKSVPHPSATDLESALPEPKTLSRSGDATVTPTAKEPTALGPRAAVLAKAQLGKPYQWGAAGPDRFDCSGLVQYVYSNLGVALPRVSGQQAGAGVPVDHKDLRPGDLVFFKLNGSRIDHVGIYVGGGRFIHAPRRHNPVRSDSLNDSWWRRRFKGGRRVG